jgi:hypothetical protein
MANNDDQVRATIAKLNAETMKIQVDSVSENS